MKISSKPVLLLSLIVIVLISGCTSTIPSGNGIIVETFEPDFTNIFSNEEVTFNIRIRNVGSVDAENTVVKMIGLDEWSNDAWVGDNCGNGKNLLAGQPTFGTPGESRTCLYRIKAPKVPQGISVPYQPTVRISYNYNSNILKTITIGSQDELKRIENGGGALPSEITSVTSSPVSLNVITQGPIRVFDGSVKFPIQITIKNVGGGVVCGDNCINSNNWNKINIKTMISDEEISDCTVKEMNLFKGQSNTVTCYLTVTEPETGIAQKTISVSADYNYFYDATTSVTVNPISE